MCLFLVLQTISSCIKAPNICMNVNTKSLLWRRSMIYKTWRQRLPTTTLLLPPSNLFWLQTWNIFFFRPCFRFKVVLGFIQLSFSYNLVILLDQTGLCSTALSTAVEQGRIFLKMCIKEIFDRFRTLKEKLITSCFVFLVCLATIVQCNIELTPGNSFTM